MDISKSPSICALVIGDPHIKTSNIPETDLFISNIESAARERNPDIIICLGDTLDTMETLHTVALNKAIEFVCKMRDIAPFYIIVGNHDMINNSQFLTSNHWLNFMKEFKDVFVVDKVLRAKFAHSEFDFVFVPYVPPGRFIEALDTLDSSSGWMEADCIFAHQEIRGCVMNSLESTLGDVWPSNFPNLISGHIHMRQKPASNIYYVGSTMQHDFGDLKSKYVDFITFHKGSPRRAAQYTVDPLDLRLPQRVIVERTIADVADFSPPEVESLDKIKLNLIGSVEEHKAFRRDAKYRELVAAGVNVVFKQRAVLKKNVETEGVETEGVAATSEGSATVVEEIRFSKILGNLVEIENNAALMDEYKKMLSEC
jgi:DNA repair exonuclease SbcCD nuclease subunit